MNQREVGTRQESRAAEYLESLGYHILVRNFRCRFGEIDLIAKQDDTYIFIEVKYRTGRTAGDPTSAVDGKKQKKISKTADADDISETASFLYPLIFSEEIPRSFNRRSR